MDDAASLLRLQMEWGADEALDPQPLDRLQPAVDRGVAGSITAQAAVVAIAAAKVGQVPDRAVRVALPERAAERAAGAETLDALRDALAGLEGFALRDTASHLVFAEGNPASTTLIIGEPPGREEDRGGHPFAGTEGALLDQMLASISLDRGTLMLAPLLPWRPPGGRPPNAAEVAVCLPFLHRLIALLRPRRLVLFGAGPARALLPAAVARRRPAPDWIECPGPGSPDPLQALYLPSLAELLKTPALRRDAWTGLRRLRRAIDAEQTES